MSAVTHSVTHTPKSGMNSGAEWQAICHQTESAGARIGADCSALLHDRPLAPPSQERTEAHQSAISVTHSVTHPAPSPFRGDRSGDWLYGPSRDCPRCGKPARCLHREHGGCASCNLTLRRGGFASWPPRPVTTPRLLVSRNPFAQVDHG